MLPTCCRIFLVDYAFVDHLMQQRRTSCEIGHNRLRLADVAVAAIYTPRKLRCAQGMPLEALMYVSLPAR